MPLLIPLKRHTTLPDISSRLYEYVCYTYVGDFVKRQPLLTMAQAPVQSKHYDVSDFYVVLSTYL